MCKPWFIIGCLLAFSSFLCARGQARKGDTLYVWYRGGIDLLSSPVPEATARGRVPYGDPVVVEGRQRSTSFIIQLFKDSLNTFGMELSVRWLRVRWKDQEGYMLNIFLGTHPVFHNERYTLENYMRRLFGVRAEKHGMEVSVKENVEVSRYVDSLALGNGNVYVHYHSDGCDTYRIEIRKTTMEEALWLLQATAISGYECSMRLKSAEPNRFIFEDCDACSEPTLEVIRKNRFMIRYYICD